MFAAEYLIEQLEKQIKLAPELRENEEPGGSVADMLERLVEGINLAHHINLLKAVESGGRRYARCFRVAKVEVEKIAPILAQAAPIRNAVYENQAAKDRAMARLKDLPAQIVAACKAAIAELEKALAILQEGEGRASKLAGAK